MAGPEATIERAVVRRCEKELGVESDKLVAVGKRARCDRLFWLPGGRPLLIEFKAPGERARPLQSHHHQLLRTLRYDVEVHDDEETAFRAVEAALRRALAALEVPAQGDEVPPRARVRRPVR